MAQQQTPVLTPINKTPGVCGGSACIGDSRIPVWTLIELKQLGQTDEQLLEDFPTLSPIDLDAAWAYYRANTLEIEQDIAAQEA
jgi:uncharacterized protein (DUF433 family)